MKRREQYDSDFANLVGSTADRTRYANVAGRFFDTYLADDQLAERTRALENDLAFWQSLDAHRKLAGDWDQIIASAEGNFRRSVLKRWVADAQAFVRQYPDLPEINTVAQKVLLAKTVLNRDQTLRPLFALRQKLKEPIYTSIQFFQSADGEWGYYEDQPVYDGDNDVYNFKVIVDRQGNKVNKDALDPSKGPAAHCDYILVGDELVAAVVANPNSMRWEDAIWKLIEHYAFASDEADPLVKYEILQQLLRTAKQSSLTISRVAEDDFNQFTDAFPSSIDWIIPGKETDLLRNKAEAELQRIQSRLPAIMSEEQNIRKSTQQDRLRRFEAVGVLDQDQQGNWRVQAPGDRVVTGEVFVAGSRGSLGQMQSIGEVDGNAISKGVSKAVMKQGRPVFSKPLFVK